MGDKRWKPIVFTVAVIIAFTFILFIFVHRSNQRERLCANQEDLLYINELTNGTCYRESTQGPCGENMILIQQPNNQSVGVCDCDFVHNTRGLVFNKETQQCYFLFTKAYCNSNEWLNPYKEGCQENLCARCEPNPCPQKFPSGSEWVQLKDGTCAELGRTHSSCKSSSDVLHFVRFKIYPTCEKERRPLTVKFSVVGVPPTRCPTGYSRTHLGHCGLEFDFE